MYMYLFIFISDWDIHASLLQFVCRELSKGLFFHCEGEVQWLWVILQDPHQATVEGRLQTLKVL